MPGFFEEWILAPDESLFALLRNYPAVIYEVYDGTPCTQLEQIIIEACDDIPCLRFDAQKHSGKARRVFCEIASDLERRAFGFPLEQKFRSMPYFKAVVFPFGNVATAWTREEVQSLIDCFKKEIAIAVKMKREIAEERRKRD